MKGKKTLNAHRGERPVFNSASRMKNVAKSSVVGILYQIINLICSFVFRTLFIHYLSIEYLGLNGLFSNVLTFLSLAELGIGSVIVYRMYKPIAQNNVDEVARLMRFYKMVYRVIAAAVALLGFVVMPWVPFLIKDAATIPADINLYEIYSLFLLDAISSYLFVYKTSIFSADQRQYLISFMNIASSVLKYGLKAVVLILTRDFTAVLIAGIALNLLNNFFFSTLAQKMYKPIFKKAKALDKVTLQAIRKDVLGMLFHKIGGVVVSSTDNILLSAFIGLEVTGIYSNYSMIIVAVNSLICQLFSGLASGVGNCKATETQESFYRTYKNVLYANLVIGSCSAIALFALLNSFIEMWIGPDMLLSTGVVAILSVNFFISQTRMTNGSFISATGLFRYDKWRPMAEVAINLVASILLVKYLGVVGIFLGTIISSLSVVWWREATLLHKKEFPQKRPWFFFAVSCVFFVFTVAVGAALAYLFRLLPLSWGFLVLRFVIAGIVPIALIACLTFRMPQFAYFRDRVVGLFRKILRRKTPVAAVPAIPQKSASAPADEPLVPQPTAVTKTPVTSNPTLAREDGEENPPENSGRDAVEKVDREKDPTGDIEKLPKDTQENES